MHVFVEQTTEENKKNIFDKNSGLFKTVPFRLSYPYPYGYILNTLAPDGDELDCYIITNQKLQFFPFAVYIEQLGEWHQATFFYESSWNMILLAIALFLGHKRVKDGTLLSTYFIGYGLGRFLIEGLRADSLYLIPGIRVSQMLSLVLIAMGIGLLILIKKNVVKAGIYNGKYSI